MSGEKEYKDNYKKKINRILNENKDKEYLEGFYYYTCSSNLNGLSSSYNYLNIVLNFMNSISKPVDKITLDDYTIYMGKIKEKSTSSYQITVYSALKKFATYLYATKKCNDNPMSFVSRPKSNESIATKEKRENGYLTKGEIKKYINTINSGAGSDRAKAYQSKWKERDMAIIKLFIQTGLRCSGLYKLDVDSINLTEKKLVTIEKGNKIKEIFLSDDVINSINIWLNKRSEYNIQNTTALFISNRMNRLSQKAISEIVKKYSINIKDKNITPHKLRATYGTILYNETKDIKFVQQCMGHNSSHTTELYIRGKNKEQEKSTKIFNEIFM